MEFVVSEDARIIEDQVVRFLHEKIIPAEGVYAEQAKSAGNGADPEERERKFTKTHGTNCPECGCAGPI